jgi:glycosyltransferase involved in cell wall biosynthesis
LHDCFEGFVMQQTSFQFVVIVCDDSSQDKLADIIREYTEKYPDIFRPIYEIENQYSKGDGSLNRIMNAAIDATGAKYVAMCEGDDYWTDPKKLQKQVEILENDSTLMGVVTNSSVVDFDGELLHPNREVAKGGQGRYDLRYFIKNNNQYPTLTVVYRNSHSAEVASMFEHTLNPFLGDWTLWIILHTLWRFLFS